MFIPRTAFKSLSMSRELLNKLFALAFAIVTVTATCSDYNTYKGPLTWQPCKQKGFHSLQCASFDVPINWNDCASDPITLTVARIPSNSSSKTGSLFIRFGGPGIVRDCPITLSAVLI